MFSSGQLSYARKMQKFEFWSCCSYMWWCYQAKWVWSCTNRLFSLLAIILWWELYWGGDVPDVINLHPSPRFWSWFEGLSPIVRKVYTMYNSLYSCIRHMLTENLMKMAWVAPEKHRWRIFKTIDNKGKILLWICCILKISICEFRLISFSSS